jgi:hypothetical protein
MDLLVTDQRVVFHTGPPVVTMGQPIAHRECSNLG